MEMYLKFGRVCSQIRQTWRYKVTITRTHTMLQMHIFILDCVSIHKNHGDVRALEHERSISRSFSEWWRQAVGCVASFNHDDLTRSEQPSSLHTLHFFLLILIPIFLILFITSLQIVFDESEDAITCQCAKHRNATARIAPFKLKCTKHSFTEGSIRHRDYDEDVFTCIQNYVSMISNFSSILM